ncbi:MAG: hypothetical protein OXL37_03915 [Chloroflexota bacterium]|nr:hypothetical protein [Chloroflexota bacterium]MDE2958535.1 hypothetical protein [Chloroflexota bacterium]
MAAPLKSDASQPSGGTRILARLTDGNQIAIFNWAKADLPDAEWFEVDCDDAGRIVLTPADEVPYEATLWAEQRDVIAAAAKPRPYAHVSAAELRNVEGITHREILEELRARGLVSKACDGPPPPKLIQPVAHIPGGLERFLKERRGEE